jgi:cyclophilin family peptidyl-prolyl cis-trans isomerase
VGTEKRERQKANRQLKYQQQAKDERRRKTSRRLIIGLGALVGGVALVLFLAWAFGSDDDDTPAAPTTVAVDTTTPSTATIAPASFTYGTGACPPAEVAEPVRQFDDAPQLCIDPDATYAARFVTSKGDIVVDLAAADVPGTVNNFVTLARYRYYDDTLIFRANTSIDIIQGGGRTNADSPGYEIPDEGSGYTYAPGDLAMARTEEPNSAGGQWFFVAGPNGANLDEAGTYVKFGTITEGLDVAQSILALAGGADGQTPTEEVTLERVEITES